MLSNKRKVELLWAYILRKGDDMIYEYKNLHNHTYMRQSDELDYLDLITAKVRMDLFEELERDIINIIGEHYHPKN